MAEQLHDQGFTDIGNLNLRRHNYPFADLLATKDGIRYFIGVKARNEMRQGDAGLNDSYNLVLISDAVNVSLKKQGKTTDQITSILLAEVSALAARTRRDARLVDSINATKSGDVFSVFWTCRTAWKSTVGSYDVGGMQNIPMLGPRPFGPPRDFRLVECIERSVSPAHQRNVHAALVRFASAGHFPCYSSCGFGARGPRKEVLGLISRGEKRKRRPDITYVLRNKKWGYPSQIGFRRAKPPNKKQKARAKREANRIIKAYAPAGTKNPY